MTTLFGGGSALNVSGTLVSQIFAPIAGQTLFNTSSFTYTPNTGSLMVFLNGEKQRYGIDYTETSTNSFTFVAGVSVKDTVEAIGFPAVNLVQYTLLPHGVTYDKIQQVTAGKVLGRNSSGQGDVQELPILVDATTGYVTVSGLNSTGGFNAAKFNGPIGVDTPDTGAFTGITVTGGTANGVTYLNGSKVLTTGSALVFDGSNLGLGVTPSAWSGNYRALDIGAYASISSYIASASSAIDISCNMYDSGNGAYKYKNSAFATFYQQQSGYHAWYTAPSGTAGNAISFVQAMTLDASGRWMLGTTTPLGSITVGDGSGSTSVVSYLNAGTGGNSLIGRISGSNTWFVGDTFAATGSGTGMTNYVYGANPWIVYTNSLERARIDSSGNLIQSAPTTPPSLATNGTMVFNLTSNTNLRISVRGSDGVTRTANLTLA